MTWSAGDAVIPHLRPADGVLQVAQCGPLNAVVNQYAQLVLDVLRYAQPVEVGKERSDVVVVLLAN